MSKFALFMRQNKKDKPNAFYAPTKSLLDKDGKSLMWEFRHITSRENDEIRDSCTTELPVTGKPGIFRSKVDTYRYLAEMIVASTVTPDLFDSELQDSYDVKTPRELLYALVDDPGEYQDLGLWIQEFQGFTQSLEDKVEVAKN